jgi:hypothetical protein
MEKQKYIRTIDGEIIIFPCTIEHSKFRFLNPISAGFCYIGKKNVECKGFSFSLELISNPEEDSLQATKQLFGISTKF